MAGIDAGEGPAAEQPPELSPQQLIEQKLIHYGVPEEQLQEHQKGLLLYMEEHKEQMADIVRLILLAGTDISQAQKPSKKDTNSSSSGEAYNESLCWLRWLMFNQEPEPILDDLERSSAGVRAVCGSVWGQNDLAYRCRTCENDPTCAICVPCFQNGNHKDHDYSIMYTGGGCCDCGDATAWKREGFCSKHKGAEQIKPLPEELAHSVGPVLDVLLEFWKEMICQLEPTRAKDDGSSSCKRVAEELTTSVAKILLEFCTCSESLLGFLSLRIRECPDLLEALLRAEKLFDKKVSKKLHELLLKLISDPSFKYEFAKVFIRYYPVTFGEVIKGCNDSLLEEYPLMPTFSVQIFTVSTLTPRLVREVNLLGILFGCLTDLFLSCIGEDGRLQTNKWGNLFDASIRLLDDTRYVLSHEEVSKYVAYERPDLTRSWIKLLSLVQGMDPQKRVTSIHVEDENEHLSAPFVLGHYLGIVQNLLMRGSFSPPDEHESTDVTVCSTAIKGIESAENQRHAKVGRVSQESSVSNISSRDSCGLPSPAAFLILQCLKAIESWLEPDIALRSKLSSLDASSSDSRNFMASLEDPLTPHNESSSNTQVGVTGVKINEASRPDGIANYHEASSPAVQGHDNRMEIDQGMPPANNNRTGKGKMHDSSNTTDIDLHLENATTYTLTDGSLLYAHPNSGIEELGILNTKGWPHVVFDISSQETSFHIPLHRMLSSLLRKAMKKCFGEDAKPDEHSVAQSNEFFSQVLRGCEPYGFASIVMEHPLRVRVFCAQVRAGMWRKNGDAAILSAEWYRSVQWFEQGLESDLFLLQCCAALSSPEFFVRTVQERFGLSSYTSLNLAEQNEFESVLMQEMLTFLIQLVKERRFCGLSTADNLKRELIYKLAIGDATHSQIVKSLPRDLSSSDQLQNVLHSLAAYSNPSGMKQGKYVLRKSCWKELDLYHPRWNSRELLIAEERYYRFCKVSALNAQLPQWTHVFNPLRSISNIATSKAALQIVRAVLFYAVYSDASSASRAPENVLVTALHLLWLALDVCESERRIHGDQCGMDVVQHDDESWVVLSSYTEEAFPILTYSTELVSPESNKVKKESMLTLLISLMCKYKEESDASFSGSKYCNIPSLIESLLKKFAKLSKECMLSLRQMAPHIVQSTPDHISTKESLGSSIDSMEKKAKARQRQAAIMAKMKAEQSKFAESMKSSKNEGHDVPMLEADASSSTAVVSEESPPVCSLCRDSDSKSPLCYLILLQKSRLATFVELGNPSWENPTQANKMSGSIKREDSTDSSVSGSSTSEEFVDDTTVEPSLDLDNMEVDAFLDFSNEQHPLIRYISSFPSGQCNGNADETVSLEAIEADIYSAILNDLESSNAIQAGEQMSSSSASNVTVDSKKTKNPKRSVLGTYVSCLPAKHRNSYVASKPSSSVTTRNRFGPVDCDGIHISSCGHAVHHECHDRYLFSLKQRYIRRLGFEGGYIVDPDLGELLCPVCRRFANSILPASPDFSSKLSRKVTQFLQTSTPEVITTSSDANTSKLQFPRALSLLESAGKIVGQSKFLKALSAKRNDTTEPVLDPSLRRLAMLYYPRSQSSFPAPERLNPSLFLWDTLRYSVVSTEIASRGRMPSNSAESKSCLESLRGELNSSTGFILSLLFRVAHSARNLNRLEVLLRFEGIQLLAGSVCSCISGYKDILNATKRKGSLPAMIDPASQKGLFPDIQFWKQCADPVLAQDPFCSLMSALFCLPVQFISSAEFFIPLVHLFYVVCVIQALVTCYGEESFDRSGFNDCLLNDVCKTMSEFDIAREYFVSRYIDPSCHPKDMVRRLTYPYLRRCALLWKLLRSSATSPLYDSSNIWEGSHLYLSNSTQDGSSSVSMELNGIRELEDLFQIQSLDLILQDESVHMLALKWSQHFCEDYSPRKYRGTLFSTPAVPFRLMQLPPVYQVLLERYVKMQCPDCGSVPDEPTLCLLCGKLCSPSWKPCCRTGKCLNHVLQCGAGVGIFLLVRKTTILLQRSARLTFWPSPYLDAFGEEDHEMQRGKPLYLSQERYAALTYLVASHNLDRTSEVLRQTTISFYGSD